MMQSIRWALCACMTLLTCPAVAREFVLTDAATAVKEGDWSISSAGLGLNTDFAFGIAQRTLHGGRQEGVELIEVDNGRMKISVIPTRGMSILRVESGDVTLGWTSPVDQIVNPAFIDLDSRGGLGWLDGFNEWLVRCGFEWAGHPGTDDGKLLTLHGRTGNTPVPSAACRSCRGAHHAPSRSSIPSSVTKRALPGRPRISRPFRRDGRPRHQQSQRRSRSDTLTETGETRVAHYRSVMAG
jgi:hypothetical protein